MSPLSNDQKQLLFDYSIGLTSEEQTTKAKALISTNKEAAEIYSKLKAAIDPLESVEPQICPDDLVESTIYFVSEHADASQHQLEQLLAFEQNKKVPIKIGFWRNLTEMAAVAASIMFIIGVLVPTMGYMRQRSWQKKCGTQQGSFFQGLSNYIADNDGQHPSVEIAVGAPYWKIGYQGKENQSNTRRFYLLVLQEYVSPNAFICPGYRSSKNLQIEPSKIQTYKDFPDRRYITYSGHVICSNMQDGKLQCRKVTMADLNPLFEELPNHDSPFRLLLNKRLLTINSSNHNGRGQNVLFADGRVEFLKTRYTRVGNDDIFTLQDTDIYQGCEMPSCVTDFFLAP